MTGSIPEDEPAYLSAVPISRRDGPKLQVTDKLADQRETWLPSLTYCTKQDLQVIESQVNTRRTAWIARHCVGESCRPFRIAFGRQSFCYLVDRGARRDLSYILAQQVNASRDVIEVLALESVRGQFVKAVLIAGLNILGHQ